MSIVAQRQDSLDGTGSAFRPTTWKCSPLPFPRPLQSPIVPDEPADTQTSFFVSVHEGILRTLEPNTFALQTIIIAKNMTNTTKFSSRQKTKRRSEQNETS